MNAEIRAHRILKKLGSYKSADEGESAAGVSRDLGQLIGRYKNPLSDGRVILVFEDGVAWEEGGELVEAPYDQMATVSLPQGKDTDALSLLMKDGSHLLMPAMYRNGNLTDCMEMIRFLDRVLADLAEASPASATAQPDTGADPSNRLS